MIRRYEFSAFFCLVLWLQIAALGLAPEAYCAQRPELVYWSWNSADDLSTVDSPVAYLLSRITVDGEKIESSPRLEKLQLSSQARRIAVVRLDVLKLPPKVDTVPLAEKLSLQVAAMLKRQPRVSALQIDFDARQTERTFYMAFLRSLKRTLPDGLPLSITALASWCMADRWLAGQPYDEVVPMCFSLGSGRKQTLEYLKSHLPFDYAGSALGLCIDDREPIKLLSSRLDSYKRIYVFSVHGWNHRKTVLAKSLLSGRGEIN